MRANKFANFVLIGGILYFIITLAYVLHRTKYHELSQYYFWVSLISIVGIVICSFAFKLRPDYKINLVLTGLSVVFGMYLVEIILSFVEPLNAKIIKAKQLDIPFDTRTTGDVITDLKKGGINAVISLHPDMYTRSNGFLLEGKRIFPMGGLSQKTTVLCNENGEWAIYESDEHGFNNPKGLFGLKEIDVMLVGDSFTHGWCVRQGEDIASQLRRMSEVRVVNLGMCGNGPLVEFASLKEYGEPLKPKSVLWMYYENDTADLRREQQQSPYLLKYLDNQFSQHLISRQLEVDSALNKFIQGERKKRGQILVAKTLLRIVTLKKLRQKLGLLAQRGEGVMSPSSSSLFTELLEKAKFLTSSWGGQLYFVYLPSWARYAKDVEHSTFHHRNRVLSIVKHLNIPIIDIHEKVFAVHPDPVSLFPFRMGGHYSSEGYRLVAQAIHTHLVSINQK